MTAPYKKKKIFNGRSNYLTNFLSCFFSPRSDIVFFYIYIYIYIYFQAVDIPTFSDLEYQLHLHDDKWTRQETEHLFDLCKRFEIRFVIVHDRWDRERYKDYSIEDLKERYYNICNTLAKVRYSVM